MSRLFFPFQSTLPCEIASDITFIVGETREKINAHRVVLAARYVLLWSPLPCPALPHPRFPDLPLSFLRLSCEVFRAMFAEQKAQAARSKSQGRSTSEYAPLVLPDVHPNGISRHGTYLLVFLCSHSSFRP